MPADVDAAQPKPQTAHATQHEADCISTATPAKSVTDGSFAKTGVDNG